MSNIKDTISYRIDSEKKSYISEIVSTLATAQNIDKGDALFKIVKYFNDTSRQKQESEFSSIKPYNCNFLEYQNETWVCLETIASKKTPSDLGIDNEQVAAKCRACYEKREFEENDRRRKLLEKDNIKKLTEFFKDFQNLRRQGFDASVVMCKCSLIDKNRIIISRDGETLYCPQQNDEVVSIDEICKNVINPVSHSAPCQYLVSIEHHVQFINPKKEKDADIILPLLEESKTNDEQ